MVVAMMLMVGTDYAISANATGHAKPTNNLEKRLNNNKSRIDQANKKAVATAKQTKQKRLASLRMHNLQVTPIS